MMVLRALLFITLATGLVVVGVPAQIVAAAGAADPMSLGAGRWAGVLLAAAGFLAYLACVYDFLTAGRGTPAPYDPPRRLVARRLYRHVRNPMYLSLLSALLGEAIYFQSARLIAYAAVVALAVHLFVVLYEEPTLTRRFGAGYEAYRQRVPRWIPRWTPAEDPAGAANRSSQGG